MALCTLCERSSPDISQTLGLCLACIRRRPQEALEIAARVHRQSRLEFGLPAVPPDEAQGVTCRVCVNRCRIPENETGYCGLRHNQDGHLVGATSTSGKLSWYHDFLPTNCVAGRVCAGGTGSGFPRYAYRRGPESGFKNLAVFFQGCSFDCLYCQNWHFRNQTLAAPFHSVEELVADVDEQTSCICYFGGDPSTQMPFSLKASQQARQKATDRILRICWETNGSLNPDRLDRMMEVAMESGGCVKFDLKAWNPVLHRVLTGVSNQAPLDNFRRATEITSRRPVPPLLVASTLLVPGYIDPQEVAAIAEFIAGLNPDIPYHLLAFHPQFLMSDMPVTSKMLATNCLQAARDCGLTRVRLGNEHLLI
ncbi:MAG: radical SAM protein [Deltaproteobacteria bacterium]|nr:radical SAM protein [Deltaproteobacteria bacterium]